MPKSNSFFNALEAQYQSKLPFVVYSRPINDDKLYKTENFSESGFVFAPFDLSAPAILFPESISDYKEIETGLDFEFNNKSNSERPNSLEKKRHIQLVSKGIDAITTTDLDKVVLSRVEVKAYANDNPITLFKRLYHKYKNAMVYCWYHPKIGLWLGATPELLFKAEGQQLTTISLAGTRAYTANEIPTWTAKELEEQQIVTDFLATQVEPFSVNTKISKVETIRAGNLLHLKTRLVSRLATDSSLKSIIEALHPTPAVCGFPKQKAKAFILQNESYNREFYTGFLGELNLKMTKSRNTNRRNVENNAYRAVKTQSNFYVNLRCMQLKDNQVYIYVGGGITKDSVAENEWEETCNKAKTIDAVLS